jgi:mycoredoxin
MVDSGVSQVTMYSTTWCGYCRRLKLLLDRAGIAYDEIDIERNEDAARFVEGVNGGNQTVPVIRYPDGSTATNPGVAQVQATLAALAA